MLGTLAHIRARYGSVEQVSSFWRHFLSFLVTRELPKCLGSIFREHISGPSFESVRTTSKSNY